MSHSSDKPRTKILVVDDSAPIRLWVKRQLETKFDVYEADCSERAEVMLKDHEIDLVLLDNLLPDTTGIQFCSKVREHRSTAELPIIMISGAADQALIEEAFLAGTNDYIRKPLNAPEFQARVGLALDLKKKSDQIRDAMAELKAQSSIDPLTGVGNRFTFQSTGLREISKSRRSSKPVSLLILDIDYFKIINDRHGHLVGDEVLINFCQLLHRRKRSYDVLCRYGGDEFVMLLPTTTSQQAWTVADRVVAEVNQHSFHTKKGELSISASIGVATCTPGSIDYKSDLEELDGLLAAADQALYRAKGEGRNRVVVAEMESEGVT